jgi:four helix bundle protein
MGTRSFRDLEVWREGLRLLTNVYIISSGFPRSELFGLTDQVKRAANSIIANIAESQGRFTFADKIRVLYQARGEAYEVRSHLSVAHELKYIDSKAFETLDSEYEILAKRISSFIVYLEKRKHAQSQSTN